MHRSKPIKITEEIGEFILKDHHNELIDLKKYVGKKILLSFHPLAWTPVCKDQMLSIEHNLHLFNELNAVCFGISIDTVFSKKAWSKGIGIKSFSMLADFWPHGEMAKTLGIFREKEGFSERANIIADEKGKTAFVKIYPISQLPDINEIIDFLKTM